MASVTWAPRGALPAHRPEVLHTQLEHLSFVMREVDNHKVRTGMSLRAHAWTPPHPAPLFWAPPGPPHNSKHKLFLF